jgi:hypothetical protein
MYIRGVTCLCSSCCPRLQVFLLNPLNTSHLGLSIFLIARSLLLCQLDETSVSRPPVLASPWPLPSQLCTTLFLSFWSSTRIAILWTGADFLNFYKTLSTPASAPPSLQRRSTQNRPKHCHISLFMRRLGYWIHCRYQLRTVRLTSHRVGSP